MKPIATESVWDYPRPPAVVGDSRRIVVRHRSHVLADTNSAVRVLETSHPPTFYLRLQDVSLVWLEPSDHRSVCEFKGVAHYWDLAGDQPRRNVAWGYDAPLPGYEELVDRVAFYPSAFECSVDGVAVAAQEGDFYGGWITPELTGPFKGGPGTLGW